MTSKAETFKGMHPAEMFLLPTTRLAGTGEKTGH